MIVWQTDPEGYLVGAVEADPDPMNPGNWLIPGGCIGTEPPTLAANEVARWANGVWSRVLDLRGTAYWLADGSRHEITERGVDLPADALDQPPPPPVEAVVRNIKAEAQRRIYAIAPAWMQANLTARSAELLRIRIENGSWTAEEAAEVQAIEGVWDKAKQIRAYSNELEGLVMGGSTPDIYAGWPY